MGQIVDQAWEVMKTAVAAEEQDVANKAVDAYKASQPTAPVGNASGVVGAEPNVYTQTQVDALKAQFQAESDARVAVSTAQIDVLTKHNGFLQTKADRLAADFQAFVQAMATMKQDLDSQEDTPAPAASASPTAG